MKELSTWHEAENLVKNYRFIILERDNDDIEKIIAEDNLLKQYKNSFIILKNIEKIKISASNVRKLIKEGQSISGMVPQIIENKIKKIYV